MRLSATPQDLTDVATLGLVIDTKYYIQNKGTTPLCFIESENSPDIDDVVVQENCASVDFYDWLEVTPERVDKPWVWCYGQSGGAVGFVKG